MAKYTATVIFDSDNASQLLELVDDVYNLKKNEETRVERLKQSIRKAKWRAKRKSIDARVNERLQESPGRLVLRKGKWWRSTGEQIITNILADGEIHHTQEMVMAALKEGYAKSSVSPRLSDMVSDGKIEKMGDGRYRLANASEG